MLWSILKVLVFLGVVAALVFGLAWILDTPGVVRIDFGGRQFFLSPIGAVIGILVIVLVALVILKLLGLLGAVLRFLLGDETAISRYFSRGRERKGFDALADGMLAVAAGYPKRAMK